MLPDQAGEPRLAKVMVPVSFFALNHLVADINDDKVGLVEDVGEECAVRPTTLHNRCRCLVGALYYLQAGLERCKVFALQVIQVEEFVLLVYAGVLKGAGFWVLVLLEDFEGVRIRLLATLQVLRLGK